MVFYNGTKEEAERQELRLSDAFPKWSKKENAALECTAVVLNINLGYNKVIMERCKKLKEYAQFIAKVWEYLDAEYEIESAINEAIEQCIRQGILGGILRNHREEVFSMLLTEYDEQAHIENEKGIAFEEGVSVGIKEGEERLSKLIQLLVKEKRIAEIEKVTAEKEYREKLYKEFNVKEFRGEK